MTVNLLTEHHSEFLGLKVGCTGSSEPIHVKIQHRWKPHVAAHFHMQLSIGYRDLYLYQIFHLRPHCMCTRSESSGFCAINTKVPLTASSQSLTFMLLYILPLHLILCFILCLNLHQSVRISKHSDALLFRINIYTGVVTFLRQNVARPEDQTYDIPSFSWTLMCSLFWSRPLFS